MSIRIYTDGSAIGNVNVTKDTPAGWGFVIIDGDTGDHESGTVIDEASGRVITDMRHPLFAGAEVGSNNTGELSAILNALEWCIDQVPGEVTILSDSQYALNTVFGPWVASKNKKLVLSCKVAAAAATLKGNTLEWEHIKAHSGFKWNEYADKLAYDAASSN
jgi:ribonuclease HI